MILRGYCMEKLTVKKRHDTTSPSSCRQADGKYDGRTIACNGGDSQIIIFVSLTSSKETRPDLWLNAQTTG